MEFDETEDQHPQQQPLAIYSKWAILGFSVFFSPVIGAILLMINLRAAGHKAAGFMVLVGGICYLFLCEILLNIPDHAKGLVLDKQTQIYVIVFNIIGGGILAEVVFKRYFKDDNYQTRSIWTPLLIIIGATFLLSMVLAKIALK
jgi:hypothetical protein